MALVVAFGVLLALPLTSLGASTTLTGTVGGLLNGVSKTLQTTVDHVLSPSRSGTAVRSSRPVARSAPQSAAPASEPAQSSSAYTPPMYGTNPHGQGGVAAVGLGSSSSVPYNYAPGGSAGELVVIGRGRSEQNSNGTYDSHTTIAALLGTELLGVNATQGESNSGPLQALQTQLDMICSSTSEAICLTLLAADTNATSSGANTHYQTAGLTSKQILGLSASAASSDSFIQTTGTCQKAGGDSNVADVGISGVPLATAASSSESSTACSGQTPTQTATSSVIGLGGTGLPLPAAGCANGTANTPAGISTLLPIYCNADSTTQAAVPAGVREALTVLGLQGATSSLLKVTTAASEAHAVAPPAAATTPTKSTKPSKSSSGLSGKKTGTGAKTGTPSGSSGNPCTAGQVDCVCTASGCFCSAADPDCAAGPNTTFAREVTSTKASSSLPFTGEDVLEVLLLGLALAGVGLGLRLRRDVRAGKR